MLRYREYDWKLSPADSRFEAYIGILPHQSKAIGWNLQLAYAAAGPEWRRCHHFDRPMMDLTISNFSVSPGDWRNLADVNFWNTANDDCPREGSLDTTFRGKAWDGTNFEFPNLSYLNWRVVRAEKSHFTIELTADTHPINPLPGPAVMASTGPESSEELPSACANHALYLIETVPFGLVTVRVPRNSPDPARHAETLARRAFNTPPADHIEIMDFKDSECEGNRSDLFVKLHYHGLHDG